MAGREELIALHCEAVGLLAACLLLLFGMDVPRQDDDATDDLLEATF
jgi:hypothetical protein